MRTGRGSRLLASVCSHLHLHCAVNLYIVAGGKERERKDKEIKIETIANK